MKIPVELKNEITKKLSKILDFFDYSQKDRNNLREILDRINQIPLEIFADFYNHLLSFDEIKNILKNADIKELKLKQKDYFENVLKANINDEYIRERLKLGVVHYNKNVKLEYYIGAYSKYISLLIEYLSSLERDEKLKEKIISLIKAFLFDMYIVIQSYSYINNQNYKKLSEDYKNLFNSINDGIVVIDVDSFQIKEVNEKIENWLGYKRETLIGKDISLIFLEERKIKNILKERFEKFPVLYMKGKRGEVVPVELSLSFSLKDGKLYAFAIVRNIKYRIEMERKIEQSSRLYKVLSIVNQTVTKIKDEKRVFDKIVKALVDTGKFNSAIAVVEKGNTLKPISFSSHENISVEKFFKKNINYIKEGFEKKKIEIFKSEDGERIVIPITKRVNSQVLSKEYIYAVILIHIDGISSFQEEEIKLFEEIADDISFALSIMEKNKKIHFLEYFDVITRIPNRRYFFEKTGSLIRDKKKLSLIVIDINRFKSINETLGFKAGDIILREFSNRLKNSLSCGNCCIARLGGDEFGIILYNVKKREDVLQEVDKIKSIVKKPFLIDGEKVYLSINIGISFYPEDGNTPEEIIAAAEAALKEAKKLGSNTFEVYNPLLRKENFEFLLLESELRNGILNQEFKLFFQPIINLRTGKIEGAEALLRWFNPKRGLVPPDRFIPILEETSLIHEVGEFIFDEACKYIKKWEAFDIFVSVNISPSQIETGNLLETILKYAQKYNIHPQSIVIELTETLLMENIKKSQEEVIRLNKYGIKMSIDDFGTGYSSLAYLKNIPFYAVKIDRSFISDIPSNSDDVKISKAIINLAHSLDKKVVAEGIETQEQLDFLKALDCDYGQGYLFSKPVPPEDFEKLLEGYV